MDNKTKVYTAIVKRSGMWTWTPIHASTYREAVYAVMRNFRGLQWEVIFQNEASERIRSLNCVE